MDVLTLEKEDFVSGLNGTTFMEVNLIVHYSMILTGFRTVVMAIIPTFALRSSCLRFLLDYFLLIIPIIGITTLMVDSIQSIFVATLAVSLCGAIILPSKKEEKTQKKENSPYSVDIRRSATEDLVNDGFDLTAEQSRCIDKNDGVSDAVFDSCILSRNRVPGVTIFRSWVTIISCICILAVDFHIFPRRLAKTEVYGTGLMDTGVGLFIVSNAIVSPESRSKFHNKGKFFERLSYTKETVIASWPLWLIGMMRFISVKMTGYQEHVSEYGVHWNFFFTLATVRILSSFFLSFVSKSGSLFLSISCIVVYQFLLLYPVHNLTGILLNEDREGFLMANKEGIASCLGYLSLYFASVQLGSFLFKPRQPSINSWINASINLFLMSAFSWLITLVAGNMIQPISRRFANLAYVSWIMSMSYSLIATSILAVVLLILCAQSREIACDLIPDKCMLQKYQNLDEKSVDYSPPPPALCLVTAVNQNQLFYFMMSNLFTGLVNIFFDTLRTTDSNAFLLISLYMLLALFLVWLLHITQNKVKYW